MEQLRHRVGAVEEAASSSQADGSARLSEVEGQYGRLKGLIEHQMRNTKETEDALRAHTQLITREVCGWTKRYIDTKLAQQPRAIAGGSSREEGSASGAQCTQSQPVRHHLKPDPRNPTQSRPPRTRSPPIPTQSRVSAPGFHSIPPILSTRFHPIPRPSTPHSLAERAE